MRTDSDTHRSTQRTSMRSQLMFHSSNYPSERQRNDYDDLSHPQLVTAYMVQL
jgi:hypothetical protein